jgi:hyaluronate lyase
VRYPVCIKLPVVAGRFLVVLATLLFAAFARADEYDDLRLKWRDTIVGTGYDTADTTVIARLGSIASSANSTWSAMDKSPTRTALWPDLTSTTVSSHINYSYQRLRSMALAYATPGCSLQGNATLLADTLGALDWMHANRYNATKSIYDNWYDFEIGAPMQLVDIAVLLYDQLSPTQMSNFMGAVEKFTPSATTPAAGGTTGTFTGSNRMWKIRIVSVRGCVVKNAAKLAAARDAVSELFVYVTTGDGFYRDGSFIQHINHPYTAAYGNGLLASIAPVMNWLSGSTWAVTDPLQSNIYAWVLDSYEPIIYRGAALDLVRGREAGRGGAPQSAGHSIMDSILQIAQFAPPAEALRMKRMIKEWALSDTIRDFVSLRPLSTLTTAKNLMADTGIVRRGELVAHYSFPQMDRVVHLGKGYGFGLSLCSTRIANFESINGENLQGWFTGDGMTTLYNEDLNQFGDNTNCTIDPYRLPGVTADVTQSKLPHQAASIGPRAQGESTLSPHSWAGGATLGNFGAAGMQFKGVGVSLTGKKSWFMFDDEIVCLGAGITSTDARPIETTVENRKINGGNAFTVNGTAKSTALGWTEAMAATSWAHLQGNVSGADIGYYFPTAPAIRAVREVRTAAPADIDDSASTTSETRNFMRLSFEHGSNPTNTTYQYVLLPGRSASRTGNYAAAPQITVLNNNANVQAVRENTLGITAANFWTDSTYTYGGITSNKKASVLVREDGPFIDVSVSDPTQLNTAGITLQIALNGGTLASADAGVTVTQSSPTIVMTVNTAGSGGKTFKARFYKLAPDVVSLTPVADSYVYDRADSVDSNFGTQDKIHVKKAGTGFNRESFLRFNVPTGGGVLLGATMKLYSLIATVPGIHAVAKVDDDTWTETGITWNNKPAAGNPISTWTPALNTTSSMDVTSAIQAAGSLSFKVHATTETSNGIVSYGTRENATATNRPQLTLIYGHTPPEVSLSSPADGAVISHADAVTLTADALATDGVVTSLAFYDGTTLLGTDSSFPYSIAVSLSGGPHDLKAIATDANGLSRASLVNRIEVLYPPVANAVTLTTRKDTPVEIDLKTLVSDVETPLASLKLQLGLATNGTVVMLPDGRTARFTPAAGYRGPASFSYTVIDTTRDDRTLLNYAFQNGGVTDSSGQGRDATLNVQGSGAASYPTDSPLNDYPKSIALSENGTAGAVRIERTLITGELDLANGDWTVTGWFKRNPSTNIDVVAQLGNSGSYGPSALTLAFYGSGTTLELRNFTSGNTQDIGLSKTNVANNAWHHFAIVRSGNAISWYHNGVLAGTDSAFALAITNSQPVKFGGSGSTTVTDRWFNGSLADLAVFDAALAPADITKLNTMPVQWLSGQRATASVAVSVWRALDSWRFEHFGTTSNTGQAADNADWDADGNPNFMEFAIGTHPKSPTTSLVGLAKVGAEIKFTYQRSRAAMGEVTCVVEWSDKLVPPWSTLGVTETIISDNGTIQKVEVKVPAGGASSRFVRLRAAGN